MSSFSNNDADALIKSQLAKALEADLKQADPTPDGGSMPARSPEPMQTSPAASGEKGVPPPADDRFEKLMSMFEAQQKELAGLKKAIKPAAQAVPDVAPRTTVKSVEQQVAELRAQLMDAEDLRGIERDLPTVPEYATIKSIPDLAKTVLKTIREEQRAARENGEGEKQVSVAQVTAKIKQTYIASLKQHLQNLELAKELGLSASASAPPASSSRALTNDLTTSGSTQAKTQAPTLDALIKSQVEKALRAAER